MASLQVLSIICCFLFVALVNADCASRPWRWMGGNSQSPIAAAYPPQNGSVLDATISGCSWWLEMTEDAFLLGGVASSGAISNRFWNLRATTLAWKDLGVAPFAISECAATWATEGASGLSLWLLGGIGGNAAISNQVWEYSVSSASWKDHTANLNALTTPLYKAVNTLGSAPGAISSASSTLCEMQKSVFVFGGRYSSPSASVSSDLWRFDLGMQQWSWEGNSASATTTWPVGRLRASMWSDMMGTLWMFGGNSGSGALSDLWKYDTVTRKWTLIGDLTIATQSSAAWPRARDHASAAYNMGWLYLFGGDDGTSSNRYGDLWAFDTMAANISSWIRVSPPGSPSSDINAPVKNSVLALSNQQNSPGARSSAVIGLDMMAMSVVVAGGMPVTGSGVDAFSVDLECAMGPIVSCTGSPPASIANLSPYCLHGMWYVATNLNGMQVDDSVCIEGTLDLRTSAVSTSNQISMRQDGSWPLIMVQGCIQMEGGVLNLEVSREDANLSQPLTILAPCVQGSLSEIRATASYDKCVSFDAESSYSDGKFGVLLGSRKQCKKSNRKKVGIAVGVSIGVCLLIVIGVIAYFSYHKKHMAKILSIGSRSRSATSSTDV